MYFLDKIAPWKKKYVRKNNLPFMNKTLQKAIMVRMKLSHPSSKIKATKIAKATLCNEITVFHFREKVREITTITQMRKTFAIIIRNSGE